MERVGAKDGKDLRGLQLELVYFTVENTADQSGPWFVQVHWLVRYI